MASFSRRRMLGASGALLGAAALGGTIPATASAATKGAPLPT